MKANVDISDILDNMDRDAKLTFKNVDLVSINIEQDNEYSCGHLLLTFRNGESIKIDVTTMPMADTAFRFKHITK